MRPHGTRGARRAPPNRSSSAPPPITAVSRSASSSALNVRTMTPMTSPGGLGTPISTGSSPTTMVRVRPNTKPVTIGFDRNSATQPMRSKPKIRRTSPVARASAAATRTASPGSPRVRSATIEPDTMATVDAGPTMSCLEEPNTAYATSASGTAYRPICTGTPAMRA